MIEIPSVYVLGVLFGFAGIGFLIVGVLAIRRHILNNRLRQADREAMHAQMMRILATNVLFSNCERVYPYHEDLYGYPTCPKCNRITVSRRLLLSQMGFPFHWWFCKCDMSFCGFEWIMVAKDDDIQKARKERDSFVASNPLKTEQPEVTPEARVNTPSWVACTSPGRSFARGFPGASGVEKPVEKNSEHVSAAERCYKETGSFCQCQVPNAKPPCSFCESLTEEEANILDNNGEKALLGHWISKWQGRLGQ